MSLVPLDVVVALALSQVADASYPRLAVLTGSSPGSMHASVTRLVRARLVTDDVVTGLPGRRRVITNALGWVHPLGATRSRSAARVAAGRRCGLAGPALVPLIPRVAHLIEHAPTLALLPALLDVVRPGPSVEATTASVRLADAVRPSSPTLR